MRRYSLRHHISRCEGVHIAVLVRPHWMCCLVVPLRFATWFVDPCQFLGRLEFVWNKTGKRLLLQCRNVYCIALACLRSVPRFGYCYRRSEVPVAVLRM